jgi:hypothetical protein
MPIVKVGDALVKFPDDMTTDQIKAALDTQAGKSPGFFQSIKNMVTGDDRQTAMSDQTPEIGSETGIADFLGPRASAGQKAAASTAITSTFAPDQIYNVLKSNTPDPVTMDKDEKGNLYAVRFDPETQQGYKVLLNRPGFSKLDAVQTGAQMAAFTPAGRAGVGAATRQQAAMRVGLASAGTQAGLSGLTQASGRGASSGEVAGEIALAGGLGGAFEALGQKVAQVVSSRNLQRTIREQGVTNELRQEVRNIAINMGVNPSDVTDDFIRSFAERPSSLLPAEREFKVTLTKGGRSLDPNQLNAEDSMRAGSYGQRAQNAYLQEEQKLLGDVQRAADDMATQIGGVSPLDNQQTSSTVVNAVRAAESADREAERAAYAGVSDAGLRGNEFKGLLNRTRNAINGIDFPKDAQYTSTQSALKYIDDNMAIMKRIEDSKKLSKRFEGRSIPVKRIEQMRRTLNGFYADAANPTDRRNITTMLRSFDDYMDNATVRSLMTGDSSAIEQYKQARRLTSDYFRKFSEQPDITRTGRSIPDNPGRFLEKVIFSNPTDEEVANALFTSSALSNKAAGNMATRFRDVLGQNSPEWNAVRQAAFRNMLGFKTEMADRVISPAKTAENIRKAMENRSLMNVLFTGEEQAKIARFANLVSRVDPNLGNLKSRVTPSGKAAPAEVMSLVRNFLPGLISGDAITLTASGVTSARTFTNASKARDTFRPFARIVGTEVRGMPTTGAAAGALMPAVGD